MGADLSKSARELWGLSLLDEASSNGLTAEECLSLRSKGLRAKHVALFDYVVNNRHMFAAGTGSGGCLRGFATRILSLDLSGNDQLGPVGIRALLHEASPILAVTNCSCSSLSGSLWISSIHLLGGGGGCAGRGIASWLTSINLSDCGLGDDGAKHVANVLFRCPRFRRRAEGAPSEPYTSRMPSLRSIFLDRNDIGDEGCSALCNAIANNLLCSSHQDEDDAKVSGATSVAVHQEESGEGSAAFFALKVLSLRHNRITDASAESLQLLLSHSAIVGNGRSLQNAAAADEQCSPQAGREGDGGTRRRERKGEGFVVEVEVVDLFGNHFGNDGLLAVGKSVAQRLTAVDDWRRGGGAAGSDGRFVCPEELDKLVVRLSSGSFDQFPRRGMPCASQDGSSPLRQISLVLGHNAIDAQGLSYVTSSVTEAHESAVLHYLSTIEQLEQCISRSRCAAAEAGAGSPGNGAARRRKSRQAEGDAQFAIDAAKAASDPSTLGRRHRAALRRIARMLDAAANFSFLRVLNLEGCLLGDDGLMNLFGMIVSFSETSALLGECAGNVIQQVIPRAQVSRYHFPHSLLLLEQLLLGNVGATSFSVDTILALFCCSRPHMSNDEQTLVGDGSPTFAGRESISALSPLSAKQKLESRLLRGTSASPAAGRAPRASAMLNHSATLRSTLRSCASPLRQQGNRRGAQNAAQPMGCNCSLPFLRFIDLSGNHFGKRGGEIFAQLFLHGLNTCFDASAAGAAYEFDLKRCQLDDEAVGSALAILRAHLFEQMHSSSHRPRQADDGGDVRVMALRLQHNKCSHNALIALRDVCNALVNEDLKSPVQHEGKKRLTCSVEGNHILLQRDAAVDWSALCNAPLGAPDFEQSEPAPSPPSWAAQQEVGGAPSPPLPAFQLNIPPTKPSDLWESLSTSSPRACPPLPRVNTLAVDKSARKKSPSPCPSPAVHPPAPSAAELEQHAASDHMVENYMAKSGVPSVSAADIERLLADAELLLSPGKQRSRGVPAPAGLKYTYHRTSSAFDREPFL